MVLVNSSKQVFLLHVIIEIWGERSALIQIYVVVRVFMQLYCTITAYVNVRVRVSAIWN